MSQAKVSYIKSNYAKLLLLVLLLVVIYYWLQNAYFHRVFVTPPRHDIEANARNTSEAFKHVESPFKWSQIFSFIPYGLANCKELFANHQPSKTMAGFFPKEYLDRVRIHKTKLGKYDEGHAAENMEQIMVYWKLAEAPFIRTVCETGFNGGHSAMVWLSANPNVHVYSFDIGEHDYARRMAKFLQELFPGRLTLTWGSSTDTLPLFRAQHPDVICDLIIVDGGHTYDVASQDFNNFRNMSARDNALIFDDYPCPAWRFNKILGPAWELRKKQGIISEMMRCSYLDMGKRARGFSVGRFNL